MHEGEAGCFLYRYHVVGARSSHIPGARGTLESAGENTVSSLGL